MMMKRRMKLLSSIIKISSQRNERILELMVERIRKKLNEDQIYIES